MLNYKIRSLNEMHICIDLKAITNQSYYKIDKHLSIYKQYNKLKELNECTINSIKLYK